MLSRPRQRQHPSAPRWRQGADAKISSWATWPKQRGRQGGRLPGSRLGTKRETNKQVKIVINIKLISTCSRKFCGTEGEMRVSPLAPACVPAPAHIHLVAANGLLTELIRFYLWVYSWISPCLYSVNMPGPCLGLARLTVESVAVLILCIFWPGCCRIICCLCLVVCHQVDYKVRLASARMSEIEEQAECQDSSS